MKPNKKAVVFDLDGTVLDTIADIAAAVNRALKAFGFAEKSVSQVQSYLGNGSLMLIKRAIENFDDEELCLSVRSRFREEYERDMCNLTKPYDGMVELMAELSRKGVKTAVVTNKDHHSAVSMINHYFGETVHITKGVVADGERKPNPQNTLSVLEELGVTVDESVFVGDGMADLMVSKACLMDFIPVSYGYTSAEKLKNESGREAVPTVEQLRNELLKHIG